MPWLPPVHAVCHVPDHVLVAGPAFFFVGLDFFLVMAVLWVFAVERWNGPVWVSFRPPVTSPPATTMAAPVLAMSATRDPWVAPFPAVDAARRLRLPASSVAKPPVPTCNLGEVGGWGTPAG